MKRNERKSHCADAAWREYRARTSQLGDSGLETVHNSRSQLLQPRIRVTTIVFVVDSNDDASIGPTRRRPNDRLVMNHVVDDLHVETGASATVDDNDDYIWLYFVDDNWPRGPLVWPAANISHGKRCIVELEIFRRRSKSWPWRAGGALWSVWIERHLPDNCRLAHPTVTEK